MTLLAWTWRLRLGPYVRASYASQPVLLVMPFGAALVLTLFFRSDPQKTFVPVDSALYTRIIGGQVRV